MQDILESFMVIALRNDIYKARAALHHYFVDFQEVDMVMIHLGPEWFQKKSMRSYTLKVQALSRF